MTPPLDPHGPTLVRGPGRAAVPGPVPGPVGEPAPAEAAVPGVVGPRVPGPRGTAARLRAPLAAAAAAAVVVAALGVTDPYRPGGHPVCPVLALTGFYCAGCGAQRAVHDLAHLDLAAAWGMNPLVVLAVPLAVLLWGRWLRRRLRAVPRASAREARPSTAWLVLTVVVAFAVLRNLPVLQPWLAP